MQLFLKLFEPYLQWFYHCFDRIVINGYLSFLTRENNAAYFFREVCKKPKITKEVLTQRTRDYQAWVQHYARNHQLPLLWPEKGVRKEDLVRPRQQRMARENRFGVYYILQSMEQGWTFRAIPPKFATKDPNFQFLRKHKSRYTHYYFYILDEVAGPMVLRVGSFLPFQVTAYLNGHNFIERQLRRQKIPFRKEDNRFLSVGDPKALQKAADQLDGKTLQQRIDYWALIVGPKFSTAERLACAGLHRVYAGMQIEYCRNFIFKRHWPIGSIFQRSCELGLYLLTADRVAVLFGQQKLRKPSRASGKTCSNASNMAGRSFAPITKIPSSNNMKRQRLSCARKSSAITSRSLASKRRSHIGSRCASASNKSPIASLKHKPSISTFTASLTSWLGWQNRSSKAKPRSPGSNWRTLV